MTNRMDNLQTVFDRTDKRKFDYLEDLAERHRTYIHRSAYRRG